MAQLHNRVRWYRTKARMSQAELADRIGVTRQAVSLIEAEQTVPSTAVALRLSAVFHVPVETLFYEEGAGLVAVRTDPGDHPAAGERVLLARIGHDLVSHRATELYGQRMQALPATGVAVRSGGAGTVLVETVPGASLRTWGMIAGCDIALGLLAAYASSSPGGMQVLWRNADNGLALRLLRAGLVHAAAVHTPSSSLVERVRNRGDAWVNFASWQVGWILRRSDGRGFAGVGDLAAGRLRLVNRPAGSGVRALLDSLLREAGVDGPSIPGYDRVVDGHLQVVDAVAMGIADVGIGMASAAVLAGLAFLPIREESCDIVIPGDLAEDEEAQRVLDALYSDEFRWDLERFGPYDVSRTGRSTL